MDVFLALRGHTNSVSLPLRLGFRITEPHQQFARLEETKLDEEGTRSQRQDEIDKGRRHYVGVLVIPAASAKDGAAHQSRCRVVLGPPSSAEQRPHVVTVLGVGNVKGDMTVTRHLEGMLKRGQITPEDVIKVFHPAYDRGDLKSSNDCQEIFERSLKVPVTSVAGDDATVRAILEAPEPVVKAVEAVASQDQDLRAPLTYHPMHIPGVKYEYVMADAYVADVWMDGDVIRVRFINSRGEEQECHSFKPRAHLVEHHHKTFAYLSERKEQRALFALCNSGPCRGFLAESVTSIALQVMKSGAAAA